RRKRLILKSKFGGLSRSISSYSIKKISRSSRVSKTQHISILAKVNRKILSRIYFRFTREKKEKRMNDLYLSLNIQLKNASWEDLGADEASEIIDLVQDPWKKWMAKNLGNQLENVVSADGGTLEKLKSWLQIAVNSPGVDILYDEKNLSYSKESENEAVSDSLWLKVNVKIEKRIEEPLIFKRTFVMSGDFILIDLKFGNSISHYDFVETTHTNDTGNSDNLKSTIAGQVYRMPLGHFGKLRGPLRRLAQKSDRIKLRLDNMRTVKDLFNVKNILAKRGVTMHFSPEIISYGEKSGLIGLFYWGTKKDLIDFLKSLKNQKVGNHSIINFKNNNPFSLYLKRIKRR
ncbi:MAG: hypothetical protein OXB84_08190, partial [Halobacteriovoraceae bacterium]|nr:hypothetical protein [Halobacteriovoraceae bacterium]